MDERLLIDQLEQAVEMMIAHPDAARPEVDPQVSELLAVADDLRDLARPEFKKQLRLELEREAIMSTTKVNPIPAGYHTITPYVTVPAAAELIEWLKSNIGFTEHFRTIGSVGGIHCELKVGDSMLMVGGGPMIQKSLPTAFHFITDQVDEMYRRAMDGGATSIREPQDQPYGERVCGVKDPSGNEWYFGKEIGGSGMHRGLRTLNVYLHPSGTPGFIDFLRAAFNAEEVQLFASPEGVVHHAKIRVGDSILEMGEAHEEFQPMPTSFYLYVPDCDALYHQALRAGAKSIAEPADHPYGDRSGAVEDAFGNSWWIATHIKDV